jgi:uncharacterized protein YjcR
MVSDKFIPTKQDLIDMRAEGFTREEIADYYGVTLSKVKRWLKKYGFSRVPKQVPPPPSTPVTDELPFDTGMTIMERAKLILGNRLTEDRHKGYCLDGRPAKTDRIIEAAGLKAVKRV